MIHFEFDIFCDRAKPTVPRKSNNDVNLAMRIKQLFENLESIEQRGETMTPRTEQRVLLNEIQKVRTEKKTLLYLTYPSLKKLPIAGYRPRMKAWASFHAGPERISHIPLYIFAGL